ncbi:hypothetical protein AAHA92_06595 [Salvia divinorum]|uniref:Uncharacterized protein n=1 Tax=Salvia divinorum TaxID=28513 RepID=A0ABD1I6Y9_SALDI
MSIGEKRSRLLQFSHPSSRFSYHPNSTEANSAQTAKNLTSRNGLLEPRRHRAAAERDYSRQALLLATDSDAATTAAMNWFMDGKICGHRSERDCLRRTAAGAGFGRRFWPRFWSSGGGTDSSVRI